LDALILAAGLGSRLMPLTKEKPKAMTTYMDVEIITHQIRTLLSQDINKIIVVTGYHSDVLERFLDQKFPHEEIITIHNKDFSTSNSAYSFMTAYHEIESDSYIHLNCDILFSKSLLSNVINNINDNVIAVRSDIALGNQMENVISLNKRIVNMSLNDSAESSSKAYGLAKISKAALIQNVDLYETLIPKIQRIENYYGLIRLSLGKMPYYLEESDKYNLAEINTHNDLSVCEFGLR
tara:strand:- start:29126 stop:29836 length:711 start_codon:yes stop_codon:yes gene_type:complete